MLVPPEAHQYGGTWAFYVIAPLILCGVVASLWLIVKGAIGVFGQTPRGQRLSMIPSTIGSSSRTAAAKRSYRRDVKTVIEGRWNFYGQRVIADAACGQIDALLRSLTPYASTEGGWTKLYRDESGVFWELTYPQSEMHGGGPPRLESLSREEMRLKHSDVNLDSR
jgi:hypothetical protein